MYGCYPVWRSASIVRSVTETCHMHAIFPSKVIPQTTYLLVRMDDSNTEDDLRALVVIVEKNATYINDLMVEVDGSKWSEVEFNRLRPLCEQHRVTINVYISHSRRHFNPCQEPRP
jgi:hypothetical protein